MVGDFTLYEDFDFRGRWWLPNHQEDAIDGVLEHRANAIRLDLSSAFYRRDSEHTEQMRYPRIILGLSHDGDMITLYNSAETSVITVQLDTISFRRSIYESAYMLVGKHCTLPEEEQFEKMEVEFTQLAEWIGRDADDTTYVYEDDGNERLSRIDISMPAPPSFTTLVPAINATIASYSWYSTRGQGGYPEPHFVTWLTIEPTESKVLDWYSRIRFDLQNLMTLFVGDAVYPKRITFLTGVRAYLAKESTDIPEYAKLFYSDKIIPPPYVEEWIDMVIRFKDVSGELPGILNHWFSKAEKLRPVYDLFFGSLYNKNMYNQVYFLNLVQALESYLRKTQDGHYVDKAKFRLYKREILKAMPSECDMPADLKKSLVNRLNYANEYELRYRVQTAIESLGYLSQRYLTRNAKAYTDVLVDTRNYLTHFTAHPGKRILHDYEYGCEIRRLRILLTIFLLREIGISETRIDALFDSNSEIHRVLDQCQNEWT